MSRLFVLIAISLLLPFRAGAGGISPRAIACGPFYAAIDIELNEWGGPVRAVISNRTGKYVLDKCEMDEERTYYCRDTSYKRDVIVLLELRSVTVQMDEIGGGTALGKRSFQPDFYSVTQDFSYNDCRYVH